jgi:putative ABC transport system permease protein
MNLIQLAWKSISRNAFRSGVVSLCALLVAAFALFTTLLMRGAETSLRLTLDRLGADIIVVPVGAEAKVESALLMGNPTQVWMPRDTLTRIAAIPGIDVVSPQLYLATLAGASCCSASNMFMIAYDPQTDFTIRPWLEQTLGSGLRAGEVVGGRFVAATEGDRQIKVYGSLVTLKANLEPTGTGLDQTMFLSFDTARDIARLSVTEAEKPLTIPQDSISAALVKVKPGSNTHAVAIKIVQAMPDVVPIESADLFQSYRKQMTGLLQTTLSMLGITWVMSVVLIGLVFSMAANERRKELGVIRAMGATRRYIFQSLITEASLLALIGGAIGLGLVVLAIYLFQRLIVVTLDLPFLLPSLGTLGLYVGVGLVLTMGSVSLAALFPAFRISREEPATAMRE